MTNAESFVSFDPGFNQYVLPNAALLKLAGGFRWLEGLVWMGEPDCLLFQNLPRNRTMRFIENAEVSMYREPSHYANGQYRDCQSRFVSCSHRDRCPYRTELDGKVIRLVDCHVGKRLNAPDDVAVKSDGTIWFSDPLYGIQRDYDGGIQESEQPPALYRFDPEDGKITLAAGDSDGPNGLVFSPDESRLYVCESGDMTTENPKQDIRAFDVDTKGELHGCEIFHKIEPSFADGICVDEDGDLWSSDADVVHCIDPGGRLLCKTLVPHVVSNLTFGGYWKNRLFIGGSHTLYAIFLSRRGAQWP